MNDIDIDDIASTAHQFQHDVLQELLRSQQFGTHGGHHISLSIIPQRKISDSCLRFAYQFLTSDSIFSLATKKQILSQEIPLHIRNHHLPDILSKTLDHAFKKNTYIKFCDTYNPNHAHEQLIIDRVSISLILIMNGRSLDLEYTTLPKELKQQQEQVTANTTACMKQYAHLEFPPNLSKPVPYRF